MKKRILPALTLILLLSLTGCITSKFGGLQMTKSLPSYEVVKDFETTVTVHKFMGTSAGRNLFNISSDASVDPVFDAIQREIARYGGDAAVNIEIEYQASFLNMLANSLTFGIWAPADVKITGTIVKY